MNNKPILIVDPNDTGQRLDNYLLKHRKLLDKGTCYKLIRKGQIRVNGKRSKPFLKLSAGDQVRMPPHWFFNEPQKAEVPVATQQQLLQQVVAENEHHLVINKPAGMPVHKGSGHKLGVIEIITSMPAYQQVQLAHRLDIDTSGCLLLAKSRPALLAFQEAMKERLVNKQYVAVLSGVLDEAVTVKQPLNTANRINGIRTVVADKQGKVAETNFNPMKHTINKTLVTCEIGTGRTHQIRVHAQHLGLPVLGDGLYGQRQTGLPRALYLHAHKLSFDGYQYEVPVPDEFAELFN